MALEFKSDTIVFEGLISEADIVPLRDQLMEVAPATIKFELTECTDMHMSIIQLIGAYSTLYSAEFSDLSHNRAYELALKNFL
jgi:hypothetical protein